MITLDIEKGDSIYTAAQKAVAHAKRACEDVSFIFNELHLVASPRSNPDDIAEIYSLKHEIRRLKKK